MQNFRYDMFGQIEPHLLILSTVWHHHLGTITNVATGVNVVLNMNSYQEISFDVHKYWDGKLCELWDDIVTFKYVYVPDHQTYYEIEVSLDENSDTIKHVTGKSAEATELGNRMVRDLHINDETDINYAPIYKVQDGKVVKTEEGGVVDFAYDVNKNDLLPGQTELIKATVLYRQIYSTDSKYLVMKKKRASLLHRVLKDKCPDWKVDQVAYTIANIQRTFTIDDSSVYDVLNQTIGEELQCMFQYDTVNRTISAVDLCNKCSNPKCNYRGDFVDKCPKCGSTKYISGYGNRTGIYLSTENYATEINISGENDNVKNCLKMTAGDDDMTTAVRNVNPNGSSYIYHFSENMLRDMPTALVDKINSYNALYESKKDEYAKLTDEWYELINQVEYLDHSMMPETPIPGETTASKQLGKLLSCFVGSKAQKVAVEDVSVLMRTSADNAVQNYARVLIDPRYKVEIVGTSTLSNYNTNKTACTWKGKFKVIALASSSDDEDPDEATSTSITSVRIIGGHENFEAFCQQKIEKTLDRSDAALMTIYNIESDTKFKSELKKYGLQSLLRFKSVYESCMETLTKQGVTSSSPNVYGVNIYKKLYIPYYKRATYIQKEIATRTKQIETAEKNRDDKNSQRMDIQKQLDFQKYLGDSLYIIFSHYLKEGEYNNSNYISTGLDNDELVAKAREFFDVASDEVIKASQIELTISETLVNLLNTKEFADFKDSFRIGDWLVTKVDNELYRLRLISAAYNDNEPASLSVSFSNVDRMKSIADDLYVIIGQAQSVAGSYNTVAHQAKQGDDANANIQTMKGEGIDTAIFNILAGANKKVQIDDHGIILKEYDDILGEDSPEQLKIINNTITFTDDRWESVRTAIGKIQYSFNGQIKTAYGVNADMMISGTMIAGDIYSSNWEDRGNGEYIGSHFNLTSGEFVIGDGSIIYEKASEADTGRIVLADNVVVLNKSGFPVPVSDLSDVEVVVAGKQNRLTAGDNIILDQDTATISAIDTTYDPFTGASALVSGTSGLVPQPVSGDQDKYLKGDGTWGTITFPTYSNNHYGTTTPSSDLGSDGDLYMLYDSNGIQQVYGKINGTWYEFPSGGGGGGQIFRPLTITERDTSTSTLSEGGNGE